MLKIIRKLTQVNRTEMSNKRNMWIVIHYVGAVSTAKANAYYFYGKNRGASAHYFVDGNEIWQVVDDKDAAWHIGGAKKYYNSARNNNSIGIEMCCKKDENGKLYIDPQTVTKTVQLTKALMKKYGITLIARHYDCTKKRCPAPWVDNERLWLTFLERLTKEEVPEMLTLEEALHFLNTKGLVTDVDYWRNACKCVKNLEFVFIKWANSLATTVTKD